MSLLKFISFVLIVQTVNSEVLQITQFCDYDTLTLDLKCQGFTSLSQLDFKLLNNRPVKTLTIDAPSSPAVSLDFTLDLTKINFTATPTIQLSKFHAINPLATIFRSLNLFNLKISFTNWLFSPSVECLNSSREYMFTGLNINELILEYPKFTSLLCPLIFSKSIIKKLKIQSEEKLKFDVTPESILDIGIKIDELVVQFSYDRFIQSLDSIELLNILMFERLKSIELNEVYVKRIDARSLKRLRGLKSLRLLGIDVAEVMRNSGSEWLYALNEDRPNKTLDSPDLKR